MADDSLQDGPHTVDDVAVGDETRVCNPYTGNAPKMQGPKEGTPEFLALNKLPPDLEKQALEELHEDPNTREKFLEDLRLRLRAHEDYVKLGVRDDNEFLLRFARARKFEQDRVFELVLNFCRFRYKTGWDRPIPLELLTKVLESEATWIIPVKDPEGHQIVSMIGKNIETTRFPMVDFQKYGWHAWDEMLRGNDALQVKGMIMIEDLEKMPSMTGGGISRADMKLSMEMVQNCMPIRLKGIYAVNPPWYMNVIWALIRPFMSKKMTSRVHLMGHGMDALVAVFGRECLPIEFGGTLEVNNVGFLKEEYAKRGKRYIPRTKHVLKVTYPGGRQPELGAGVREEDHYVSVAEVDDDGLAAQMGLEPKDVIDEVNGGKVRTIKDLKAQLKKSKNGCEFIVHRRPGSCALPQFAAA